MKANDTTYLHRLQQPSSVSLQQLKLFEAVLAVKTGEKFLRDLAVAAGVGQILQNRTIGWKHGISSLSV